MFRKLKKTNGITLIALIISIVVLLILAGISISLVIGDNGVLTQASSSVVKNREAKAQEEVTLAWGGVDAEYWADWAKNTSEDRILYFSEKLGRDRLNKYLEGYTGKIISGPTYNSNSKEFTLEYRADDQGKEYTFVIDENGNISMQESKILVGEVTILDENGDTIEEKIQVGDGKAYIHFTASLTNSNDLTVTCTGLTPILTNGEWVTEVENNGEYTFNITGKSDGKRNSTSKIVNVNIFTNLPKGFNVGSRVTYTPSGATYKWRGEYATVAEITNVDGENVTEDDVILNSNEGGNDRIINWIVFDIDEYENILIVPYSTLTTKVKLEGANGYNNAVYLLNDACKTLYSNDTLGITGDRVRNISIEDIENIKDESYVVTTKEPSNSTKENLNENNQAKTELTRCPYYPLIYSDEIRSVINENENLTQSSLKESEQNYLFNRDGEVMEIQIDNITKIKKQATNGYITATDSIRPFWSARSLSPNAHPRTELHRWVLDAGNSGGYWVASRCIEVHSWYAWFDVFDVYYGGVGSTALFCRPGGERSKSYSLFPIISLNSEQISSKTGGGFEIK